MCGLTKGNLYTGYRSTAEEEKKRGSQGQLKAFCREYESQCVWAEAKEIVQAYAKLDPNAIEMVLRPLQPPAGGGICRERGQAQPSCRFAVRPEWVQLVFLQGGGGCGSEKAALEGKRKVATAIKMKTGAV